MNKRITYIAVAATMLLVFSFDNVISGDFGATMLEEVIGFILLLIGFFSIGPIIEKLIHRFEQKWTWSETPVQRFGLDSVSTIFGSLIISGLLVLSIWLFFESFGIPKIMDRTQNATVEMVEPGGPPPPRIDQNSRPRRPQGQDGKFAPRARPGMGPKPTPLGIRNKNFQEAFKYQPAIMFGSFILLIMIFLFEESALHTKRKEEKALAGMQLAQDQMLSKINALKGQINPHFMFNNLNTLSGLIHEDVDRADRFIHSLSKNLRYVLEQNKEVMVSLEKELDFIKSYIHLQEERFGHKLKIHVEVSESDLDYQLPALTLELLIENALKHNIVSSVNPLSIQIKVEKDFLIVTNTYQPKKDGVESTGIGIQNLREQLDLLGLNGATFGVQENLYIARIPMLRLPDIKAVT